MLKRTDIVDGPSSVYKDYGLIYTCLGGWVDLSQARPAKTRSLWSRMVGEAGTHSLKHPGFRVQYGQPPNRYSKGVARSYYVRSGLSSGERESVALAIFMEVMYGFQTVQPEFPYGWSADSGFTAENLVSSIIGFYRTVRPGRDYISMCQPIPKEAALEVWDAQRTIGKKRSRFFGTYVYPSIACGMSSGPMCAPLPKFLTGISPARKGPYFHDWNKKEEGLM